MLSKTMAHEIIKQFNETYNFWQVSCSEGHKITSWKETDDIKEYAAFKIAYCPKDTNLDLYHCVTDEEDAKYIELRDKAVKEYEDNKEELSTITAEE